jgi:hypothetical protein
MPALQSLLDQGLPANVPVPVANLQPKEDPHELLERKRKREPSTPTKTEMAHPSRRITSAPENAAIGSTSATSATIQMAARLVGMKIDPAQDVEPLQSINGDGKNGLENHSHRASMAAPTGQAKPERAQDEDVYDQAGRRPRATKEKANILTGTSRRRTDPVVSFRTWSSSLPTRGRLSL